MLFKATPVRMTFLKYGFLVCALMALATGGCATRRVAYGETRLPSAEVGGRDPLAAGLLGFFGGFGTGHFYAGDPRTGTVLLLVQGWSFYVLFSVD